jgi:glutamine cyclotransferase
LTGVESPILNQFAFNIFIKGSLLLFGVILSQAFPEISKGDVSNQKRIIPVYSYRIVNSFPHDREAFTQGLVFDDGVLYEGTGIRGKSELRKVEIPSGKVLKKIKLQGRFFGEGITIYKEKVIQLTWRSHIGFVYDKRSLRRLHNFYFPTEGWGITHDGTRLIMSDGTSKLYFLNVNSFNINRVVEVRENGVPLVELNELEYVNGEVWANVWTSDRIARISPDTGQVIGWIDLRGLLKAEGPTRPVDVLNGIAYDKEKDRLFVTGKLWPKLFEIELVPPK